MSANLGLKLFRIDPHNICKYLVTSTLKYLTASQIDVCRNYNIIKTE